MWQNTLPFIPAIAISLYSGATGKGPLSALNIMDLGHLKAQY